MTGGLIPMTLDVDDPEALRAQEAAYADLADAVRHLVDATVRTEATNEQAAEVAAQVRALTATLLDDAQDGPLGLQLCSDGRLRDHGNPAVGMRNPIAPPLVIEHGEDGASVSTRFELGAAYEGPPGHVHGGISAMVLDQLLGTTAALRGKPGLTAYLNLTYRQRTPLGPLACEAWVAEASEWKTLVKGHLLDEDGRVTVEAEGLFVVPTWARDALSIPQSDAADFPAPRTEPTTERSEAP
jgi:acyl-coenzyme A thioesterase PaaI-like protein